MKPPPILTLSAPWFVILLLSGGCANENDLISHLSPNIPGESEVDQPVEASVDNRGEPSEGEIEDAPVEEPPEEPAEDPCTEDVASYDITNISVLEDKQVLPDVRDAVIIENPDAAAMDAAGSWRVLSVDVMPVIPHSLFGSWPDGQKVEVEVWDANNPMSAPWTLTQRLHLPDLTWTRTVLPTGEDVEIAWWNFSFDSIIPATGMTSDHYLVGVHWVGSNTPPLGYSNYDLDCSLNWTNWGSSWVLNGSTQGYACSYPMMRINLEVTTDGDCED